MTYGRSQNLRETVSWAPSHQRSLLLPTSTWTQENLWIWILFTEFILHLNLGFAISSLQLKIPKIWRRALIVAIPKPEKPLGDPNSYHPISLQCVPFKILWLIYARVEQIIDPLLPQEQVGFQQVRSTIDQVTLLTQNIKDSFLAKKARTMSVNTFILVGEVVCQTFPASIFLVIVLKIFACWQVTFEKLPKRKNSYYRCLRHMWAKFRSRTCHRSNVS